jgi:hypothetical protein
MFVFSNHRKTVDSSQSYRPLEPGQQPQQKYETMLVRTYARLTMKTGPKLDLFSHMCFTEHLVRVFERLPFKSDLN